MVNKKLNFMLRPLAVLMALVLTLSCFATASAQGLTADQWESYYSQAADASRGIIMQPGATESERNFSWYMTEPSEYCRVSLSQNPDMSASIDFDGEIISTYQGDSAAKVTVSGIEAGTTYYYVCKSEGYQSEVYSFTAPNADSFTAMYVTDIHISGEKDDLQSVKQDAYTFNNIIAQAKQNAAQQGRDISMLLSAGDQASRGYRSEYTGLTSTPEIKSMMFATTIGNHDRKGVDYKFFNNVPNEYIGKLSSYQGGDYWYRQGNVLFMVIDSNNTSGLDHRSFVSKTVAANSDAKWRIVMMHHDLWGQAIPHRESENQLLRLLWTGLIDEFNIDLVLLGHSHYYSVSDVMYNRKSVAPIENGGTLTDAQGTIYMVSGSLTRPRDIEGEIPYGENISIGALSDTATIYNLLDFNGDEISVRSYCYEDNSMFASFTLQKTEENAPVKISFFRTILAKLAELLGSIVALFNNSGNVKDLKKAGYLGI